MAMNEMDVVVQLAPRRKRNVFSPPKHLSDRSVFKAAIRNVSISQRCSENKITPANIQFPLKGKKCLLYRHLGFR